MLLMLQYAPYKKCGRGVLSTMFASPHGVVTWTALLLKTFYKALYQPGSVKYASTGSYHAVAVVPYSRFRFRCD